MQRQRRFPCHEFTPAGGFKLELESKHIAVELHRTVHVTDKLNHVSELHASSFVMASFIRGIPSPNCTIAKRRPIAWGILSASSAVQRHLPINHVCHVATLVQELHHLFAAAC